MPALSTVIVVGGGIGGLATALSVSARGHHSVVLEKYDTFAELGAGIQLGPNAFHALDRLGVGDAVRRRAVYIDHLRFMDGTTGRQVAALPLDDAYRGRFGNPYAVVHRTDLYQPLLEACQESDRVELWPGSPVTGYLQDRDRVTAILACGRGVSGDALIGADGIRSTIRTQLLGDGDPRVSGHTIYRSVIPMDRVPERLRWNAVTLWAGPRWHFVHYPIATGTMLNLAATRDDGALSAVAGVPAGRDAVLKAFRDLSSTAAALLELGSDWKRWVLCDRDPVDKWNDRRVVLMGDAAHPMLQYAAQGACQALEDAVHLGDLLDLGLDPTDYPQVFETFTADRRDRTAAAQLVAREMGRQLFHPSGNEAVRRNARLASLSHDDMYEKVGWLHGARKFGAGSADTVPILTGHTQVHE